MCRSCIASLALRNATSDDPRPDSYFKKGINPVYRNQFRLLNGQAEKKKEEMEESRRNVAAKRPKEEVEKSRSRTECGALLGVFRPEQTWSCALRAGVVPVSPPSRDGKLIANKSVLKKIE